MDEAALKKELLFLILQILYEEGFVETTRMLGRESRLYFELKYLEGMVLAGKWDDAETYLSGFTKIGDNEQSRLIYFQLRRQKYIEALGNDRAKALDIFMKDLKIFIQYYDASFFNQLAEYLTLKNMRERESLSTYGDTVSWRSSVMNNIKQLIGENPLLKGKLKLPSIDWETLREFDLLCNSL